MSPLTMTDLFSVVEPVGICRFSRVVIDLNSRHREVAEVKWNGLAVFGRGRGSFESDRMRLHSICSRREHCGFRVGGTVLLVEAVRFIEVCHDAFYARATKHLQGSSMTSEPGIGVDFAEIADVIRVEMCKKGSRQLLPAQIPQLQVTTAARSRIDEVVFGRGQSLLAALRAMWISKRGRCSAQQYLQGIVAPSTAV